MSLLPVVIPVYVVVWRFPGYHYNSDNFIAMYDNSSENIINVWTVISVNVILWCLLGYDCNSDNFIATQVYQCLWHPGVYLGMNAVATIPLLPSHASVCGSLAFTWVWLLTAAMSFLLSRTSVCDSVVFGVYLDIAITTTIPLLLSHTSVCGSLAFTWVWQLQAQYYSYQVIPLCAIVWCLVFTWVRQ